MTECIKLAKAIGWKYIDHCGTKRWITPDNLGFTGYLNGPQFDPFTDANDCYALIKHLNGLGWEVTVHHSTKRIQVQLWKFSEGIAPYDLTWEGDNWKHGVCKLTLKVINNEL